MDPYQMVYQGVGGVHMEERPEELDELLESLGKFLAESDPEWAAEVYALLEKQRQSPANGEEK